MFGPRPVTIRLRVGQPQCASKNRSCSTLSDLQTNLTAVKSRKMIKARSSNTTAAVGDRDFRPIVRYAARTGDEPSSGRRSNSEFGSAEVGVVQKRSFNVTSHDQLSFDTRQHRLHTPSRNESGVGGRILFPYQRRWLGRGSAHCRSACKTR